MNIVVSLAVVAGLFALPWLGTIAPALQDALPLVLGVGLPYLAVLLFLVFMVHRVMSWAGSAVPFRIPTTCGQQKSLPWIKQQKFENPHNTFTVVGRMALEVLFFRSLLRNTKAKMVDGRLVYDTDPWLWLAAMAMHWSFAVILVRHIRLMTNPVPYCVTFLEQVDGFLEVLVPVVFVTTVLFVAGLAYLLFRRLASPQLRYISLAADYFPLFLLLGIGVSGLWLRHVAKADIVGVKQFIMGLVTFRPSISSEPINPIFLGHLVLVSVLLAYFPFSKLTHMAGVFLSPTRNLANTNRSRHHANPWDYPVKVHPYDEYEDELREKMKGAGLPVEKE